MADFPINSLFQLIARFFEVIIHLEAQPETGRISEVTGQSQRGIGRDSASAVNDFVDPARGDSKFGPEAILAEGHRIKEFFLQNMARMNGRNLFHGLSFMVVNNFNVVCSALMPGKTNAPLNVDPYAELSFSIS
jgi:hypothetical protein